MANWFQRRVFRQQEVLYDAIIAEIKLSHPDTFADILNHAADFEKESSSSSQNKTPFVNTHHILISPWESLEVLHDHFSANAPQSKSKQKYLKVVELLCSHDALEEHSFDMNTIIQQLIVKVIHSFNAAKQAAECAKLPVTSSHQETNLLWQRILASSKLEKSETVNNKISTDKVGLSRRITPTSIAASPSKPTSPRTKHKLMDEEDISKGEELKPKSPKLMRKTIDLDAIITQGRFDNFSNLRAAPRVWGIEYFAALNAIPFVPVAELEAAHALTEQLVSEPPLKSPRTASSKSPRTTCSSDSGSTRSSSPPTARYNSNPFPPRNVALASVFDVPFIALPVTLEEDDESAQNTQYNTRSAEDTESTMSDVSINSTEIKLELCTEHSDPILNIAHI
eukprot:gene37390-46131_t